MPTYIYIKLSTRLADGINKDQGITDYGILLVRLYRTKT